MVPEKLRTQQSKAEGMKVLFAGDIAAVVLLNQLPRCNAVPLPMTFIFQE